MATPEVTKRGLQLEEHWFPGRWVGGVSMIVAPLLLLAGVLLRIQFHFFFPQQLAAFREHPTLVSTSYNLFLAGNITLWPGILLLATLIGAKRPGLALWGGTFALSGLFARTFHAGADYLAFQTVRFQGVQIATSTVAGSYGTFHVVSGLNGAIFFGWILLAIGAYLSSTLGLIRAFALSLMSALMMGVLKGSSATSVVAVTGLCVALVPLGIAVLRTPPIPRVREVLGWVVLVLALISVFFVLGQLG